jgi:type I restriction enzyme S subunit
MDGFFYTDFWGGQEGLLVQRVCRLRAKNESLHGYLLEAIREPIKYYEKTISGATVAHLGAKHLKEIEVIMPSVEFIDQLEIFSRIKNQKVALLSQLQILKEARDILLPRLMNRTIEV